MKDGITGSVPSMLEHLADREYAKGMFLDRDYGGTVPRAS